MIRVYKTIDGRVREISDYQQNSWIQMTNPSDEEIEMVSRLANVEEDYLRAALDLEETSRVEEDEENNCTLIAVNVPKPPEDNSLLYQTIPLGIVNTKFYVITVCVEDIQELRDFADDKVKNIFINLKTRFILELIINVITSFIKSLRRINNVSNEVEKNLHESSDNQSLYDMLDLEKSTVFYSTALNSNKLVIDKISKGRVLKMYSDDKELMEDLEIEVEQAITMCSIYSNILSGTMDAFASIISNNLNIVMKILTIITIIISVPTSIFSFYGMNVGLPMGQVWFILLLAVFLTAVMGIIMWGVNSWFKRH